MLKCNKTQTSNPDSGPYPNGCSISCAPDGPDHKWTSLQPGSIKTPEVCVIGARSNSLGSGRSEPLMGKPRCLRVSTNLPTQPGSFQVDGPGLSENDTDCTGLAQHALVLGPGQSASSDSIHSATAKGSGDTSLQRTTSPKPLEPEPTCLAPRASVIQRHGFSDEMAARSETPQRLSTRVVYKSKWAVFVKWCKSIEVDFRSPSVNQIADFLLHLFKDRKLQPSTIEGYRTAIADMVGNDRLNISKDVNLTLAGGEYPLGTSHWYFTS